MALIKKSNEGFTFTEVLFTAVISVVIIGTIITTWGITQKVWRVENVRAQRRLDLLQALETIQNDMRRSSATYISLYPEGGVSGVYTAISMPLADLDTDGYSSLNSQGDIDWDKTVVYYINTNLSGEKALCRMTIAPRDNTLDQDERYAQLQTIVTSGLSGTGVDNDTDFLEHLEHFEIKTLPVIIDFYEDSSDPVRVGKQVFGWVRLDAGDHEFEFTVNGKNDLSSGYAFGLDNIRIEPCGSKRETEYYSSSFAPVGTIDSSGDSINTVAGNFWDNDNYLEYDATGVGDYIKFNDYYDLIRESSFGNASMDNTMLAFDDVRLKLELPQDRESGKEQVTWMAYSQVAAASEAGIDANLPQYPVTIRNKIKSNFIDMDGDMIRVRFSSSSEHALKISKAYITTRDSYENGFANRDPSGYTAEEYHRHQQLYFKDTYDMDADSDTDDIVPYVYIPADSEVWCEWTAFPLRAPEASGTSTDYLVTLYIPDLSSVSWPSGWPLFDPAVTHCKKWTGLIANNSFILHSGTYTPADSSMLDAASGTPVWDDGAGSPAWNGKYSNDISVYIVSKIDTWNTAGTVESEIYDTDRASPGFNEVKWSEFSPAGTEITMKVRSSASQFMDGATDWDSLSGSTSNPAGLALSDERYVQFMARLTTVSFWETPTSTMTYEDYITDQVYNYTVNNFPVNGSSEPYVTGVYSTWLDDVEIDWPGEDRICVLSGYIARENDYGQVKITVDGMDLIKTLDISAGVSSTALSGDYTIESNSIAVEPRNTGR